jgi:hypothetical protein
MRTILKFTAILLILAGSFSCGEDGDDDMSDIDFSNIDNLYEQPLPVIQKCIRGKWKVYADYGGFVGISYPKNTFIEFRDDHFIMDYDDGSRRTVFFHWEKLKIQSAYYRYYGDTAFVMCDNEKTQGEYDDNGLRYFESIRNDTLSYPTYPTNEHFPPMGSSLVRVK